MKKIVPVLLLICITLPALHAQETRRLRKTFQGQLAGVVADLRDAIQVDPQLKGQSFRIGKVTTSIPDSHFELAIERQLSMLLKDKLSDDSNLFITCEYNYVEGVEVDNQGLSVVELIVKVTNRRGNVLQRKRREVNESDDITLLTNTTVAVQDTPDIQIRNQEIERAFDNPSFDILKRTQIAAKSAMNYTVEIRIKKDGRSTLIDSEPESRGGMAFVPIHVDDSFEIVVRNYDTQCDVIADVRIDGLSVANTFCEDEVLNRHGQNVGYPGYLVSTAESATKPGIHSIKGWLRTANRQNDNVYKFVVNEFGKGAASAMKSRGSRGVITVRFFQAARDGERLRGRAFGEVGTGKPTSVKYEVVPVEMLDTAESTVNVRYSIPQSS